MRYSSMRLPLILLASILAATPAAAQKASDTLRIAFQDPISTLDLIRDRKPETLLTSSAVFDGLVALDPDTRACKPNLAESWTRVSDKIIEFKLRRGIRWHDGKDFTADDVVFSYTYYNDPAEKLRFRQLGFVERAEKVDDYTVRIIEKDVTSHDMHFFRIHIRSIPNTLWSRSPTALTLAEKTR